MMMKDNVVQQKSYAFVLRIIKAYKFSDQKFTNKRFEYTTFNFQFSTFNFQFI